MSKTWLRLSDFVQGPSCAGLLIIYSPGYRPGGAYRDEIDSHPIHFFTPAWALPTPFSVLGEILGCVDHFAETPLTVILSQTLAIAR